MTIQARMIDHSAGQEFVSETSDQITFVMEWESRGKWYTVSNVTITHNPEYPTPTISVVAPNQGIGFRVTDHEGALLFTTRKEKETE